MCGFSFFLFHVLQTSVPPLSASLRTWDLRASIAFYTEVLGFECESLSEEQGWASLRRDGVAIMLAGPNPHEGNKAPAFTGSLYFHTDDVDGLWQRLKDKARTEKRGGCWLQRG